MMKMFKNRNSICSISRQAFGFKISNRKCYHFSFLNITCWEVRKVNCTSSTYRGNLWKQCIPRTASDKKIVIYTASVAVYNFFSVNLPKSWILRNWRNRSRVSTFFSLGGNLHSKCYDLFIFTQINVHIKVVYIHRN